MNNKSTLVALALTGALVMGPGAARAAGPELRTLDSLDQLRAAFLEDAGTPRLVLLLSPT